MGTVIETSSLDQALGLVGQAYGILEQAGCNRVYSSLKLDIRKGKEGRLKGKVDSVRQKIGDVAD
jgi:uncharacterized protein YqgV (UPF0045/DUF77 family)